MRERDKEGERDMKNMVALLLFLKGMTCLGTFKLSSSNKNAKIVNLNDGKIRPTAAPTKYDVDYD